VIDTPVQLADIVPTVMGWLGLSLPPNLAGRPLPTDANPPAEVPLVTAEFYDIGPEAKSDANLITKILVSATDKLRQKCDSRDRVYGDMRSLIRSPLKLVWYEDYPSELFDLSVDRKEQHDLAAERPAIVAQFTAELEKLVARGAHHAPSGGGTLDVPADVQERLRALGYVDVPDKSNSR
jgi:arylsulfatase A-like enzyme